MSEYIGAPSEMCRNASEQGEGHTHETAKESGRYRISIEYVVIRWPITGYVVTRYLWKQEVSPIWLRPRPTACIYRRNTEPLD